MKKNFYNGGILKANNPKTVFWSSVGTACVGGILVGTHYIKKYIDHRYAMKMKELETSQKSQLLDKETDCEIRKMQARTVCKILKKTIEGKEIKSEFKKINEGYNDPALSMGTPAGLNLHGHSTDEILNRVPSKNIGWIVEGYMAVGIVNLFVAGGGIGKSNILVQIAIAVAKGIRPEFLPDSSCCAMQLPVVYYRLEDFNGELEGKYGKGTIFNGTDITWYLPKDIEDFTIAGFTTHIKSLASCINQDTLVCIDPATKLPGYKHTDFIRGLEEAMKIAKQRGYTLTPIASVHLDEIKNWVPLSAGDIKGGDKALQQAGSVTAMRLERTSNDHRYLKSLKDPKGSPTPFDGKVLVIKTENQQIDESNKYIHYVYDNIKPEAEAIPIKPKAVDTPSSPFPVSAPTTPPNQKITPDIGRKIDEMFAKGMKANKIATKLGLSERTIRRYKKNHNT